MADTKISALTAVTTPASTDEFAVNQGGTTKKQTRAQIHALESGEKITLPQDNNAASPTIQFGDGNTGFYESSDNILNIAVAGAQRYTINLTGLQTSSSFGSMLQHGNASDTVPTVVPNKSDANTGIGQIAADSVSIIAGGLEGARVEDPADLAATETSLWLYDLDNGAIQQVTVGAADSGGSGFKVLRIPN